MAGAAHVAMREYLVFKPEGTKWRVLTLLQSSWVAFSWDSLLVQSRALPPSLGLRLQRCELAVMFRVEGIAADMKSRLKNAPRSRLSTK